MSAEHNSERGERRAIATLEDEIVWLVERLNRAEDEIHRLRAIEEAASLSESDAISDRDAQIVSLTRQLEAAEAEAARLADESDQLLDQLTLAAAEIERLRKIEAAARLVSEWHDSIGTGPIEELDAELGELHALTHPEAER